MFLSLSKQSRDVEHHALDVIKDVNFYTVNHEKRDILFLTITLANLNRFFYSFYIILIVKKFCMQLY